MLRKVFSVAVQSMQASVIDTPYCRSARSFGIAWQPQFRWTFDHQADDRLVAFEDLVGDVLHHQRLQGRVLVWSLAWLQSTMMFGLIFALFSACSQSATLTES